MSDAGRPRTDATARRTRLARVAGTLGAAVGLSSLAGCSSSDDDDDATASPTPGDPTAEGSTTAPDTTPTPDPDTPGDTPASTPGATRSPAPTDTPTPERSAEACAAELDGLEAELATARSRLEAIDAERPHLDAAIDRLEIERDVLTSKPSSVLEAAEAVGVPAREAVVFLDVGTGHATGWYVDDHHVVTNAHNVVDTADGSPRDPPTVWTLDGDGRSSEIVDYEPTVAPDVAILRTDATAPATLDLADEPAATGDVIVQVGNPGSVGNWVVSVGDVEGTQEVWTPDGTFPELVSDVPGTEGVSGSPVVNLDGGVVGMTKGGSDRDVRQPDERPVPHPALLYDRQLAVRARTRHETLDTIRDRYERWV